MTFSASDVRLNSTVNCDPDGTIAQQNIKKIEDLLQQVGEQLGGDTLETNVENIVNGMGLGATGIFVCESGSCNMFPADYPEKDLTFTGSSSLNTTRWQLEPGSQIITDLTGGGPFLMCFNAFIRIDTVRNSGGVAYAFAQSRSSSIGGWGHLASTYIGVGWQTQDVAVNNVYSNQVEGGGGSTYVKFSGLAGNQYKTSLRVSYGSAPGTQPDFVVLSSTSTLSIIEL